MLEVPVRQDEAVVPGIARNCHNRTVAAYARHKPECERAALALTEAVTRLSDHSEGQGCRYFMIELARHNR
jgi:hypothetical protein